MKICLIPVFFLLENTKEDNFKERFSENTKMMFFMFSNRPFVLCAFLFQKTHKIKKTYF